MIRVVFFFFAPVLHSDLFSQHRTCANTVFSLVSPTISLIGLQYWPLSA